MINRISNIQNYSQSTGKQSSNNITFGKVSYVTKPFFLENLELKQQLKYFHERVFLNKLIDKLKIDNFKFIETESINDNSALKHIFKNTSGDTVELVPKTKIISEHILLSNDNFPNSYYLIEDSSETAKDNKKFIERIQNKLLEIKRT